MKNNSRILRVILSVFLFVLSNSLLMAQGDFLCNGGAADSKCDPGENAACSDCFPSGPTGLPSGGPAPIKPSGGDDPCKATRLKTGLACTQFSNDTSTASTFTKPACWADVQNDVWFSFVATSEDMTISTDAIIFELFPGTTNSDTEMAFYKSNDGGCTSLTELGCDKDSGINSGIDLTQGKSGPDRQSIIERTSLIPGDTYYIRVQGQSGGVDTDRKGNFCLSAFDTYTVGSKPCESQKIYPNNLTTCNYTDGNAVKNKISTNAYDPATTMQPNAYLPLGKLFGTPLPAYAFSCAPQIKPDQYGGWVNFDADDSFVDVENISGQAMDYTLLKGTCTKPMCVESKTGVANGAKVTFSGLTLGTTYYILSTLASTASTDGFNTSVCTHSSKPVVHPPTEKNEGGVPGAGGTVNTDKCSDQYPITVDQVYKTTTYGADKSTGAPCSFGKEVWFRWDVPSTYPGDATASQAFFQMWNKNCTSGPGSIGTRLIVGAEILGDPCAGSCLEFSSPSQNPKAGDGSSGDANIYTDAATNVGWNPKQYGTKYWGMFQSGNDGSGNSKEVCDFNFMIGSTPSLKGIEVNDDTICEGQTVTLMAKGGTKYEWADNGAQDNPRTLTGLTPGIHTYTVTALAGADGYAVATIWVIPYPFTVSATSGAICSSGSSATLTATANTTSTLTPNYYWTPATALDKTTGSVVKANPSSTTTYSVTAIIGKNGSFPGCSAKNTTTVTVGGSIPIQVNPGAVCSGKGAVLTASGPTGATYTWTPNSTISSTTGATVTVTPNGPITYTVNGEVNGCKGSAQSIVSVYSNPTITVNSPTVCNGVNATLTASGGTSYVWQPGGTTTNPLPAFPVTADVSYTVTGTDANGCSANAVSNVKLAQGLNVTISGSGAGFCPASPAIPGSGGSETLTASGATSYTWTPSTGLDNANSATVIATPSATTTYTVNGSDANGCTGSDTETVTLLTLDDVQFSYSGGGTTFCANSTSTAAVKNNPAMNGVFTISPTTGGVTIDATTGAITVPATPTVGTYSVTLTTNGTNPSQCQNAFTLPVTVVLQPDATFNYSAASYCTNGATNPTVQQSGSASKGTFTATPSTGLSLNATTGDITLSTSTPGTYTVKNTIAASGSCSLVDATTTVTIVGTPVINVVSATVCQGTSGTITASAPASPAATFTWAGGFPAGATLTDSPASTTTYSVTGTDNGCSSVQTGTITVTPNPVVGIIEPADICPGQSATLTATGATTYTWSGGSGSGTANNDKYTDSPTATTPYTVVGAIGTCTATATGDITMASAPTIDAGADFALCTGQTAALTANGGVTYTWMPGNLSGETINIQPTATTTYTITGTGTTPGCNGVGYITVTVNQTPSPTIAVSNATICLGSSTTLTASPAGAATYVWSPNGTGNTASVTVTPTATGSAPYSVTVTSTEGCKASANATVLVNAIPNVTANNPIDICEGESATLSASGATTYVWAPAGTGSTANPSVTPAIGTNTYTVTGTTSGCSKTATAIVNVSPNPVITATNDTVCAGTPASLTATSNQPSTTFNWLPGGANGATIAPQPSVTTSYTVTGTTILNCPGTAVGKVVVSPIPVAAFESPADMNLSEANITFVDKSTNASQWAWDFGDGGTSIEQNPQYIYTDTGTFVIWLKVQSAGGCSDSTSNQFTIVPDLLMFIPNAFTPDGDDLNDQFSFKSSGLKADGFEFRIFDRWGVQMFSTTNINDGWDGKYKGQDCPQDVYVYSVTIRDNFKKEKKYVGNIILVR